MAYKVQKPCRVCGKMYTPCGDCERDKTAFHWRTVACSYACGMEYFKRVEEARKPKTTVNKPTASEEPHVSNYDNKESKRIIYKKNKNKEESEQIE